MGERPSHLIAVAASAGGVDALRVLVAQLPADLDAALCIVLHIPATSRSLLAPILDRAGRLTTVLADDGAPLRRGTIYVAPADHHLVVSADRIALTRGPKENGVRPAADPLFRSVAREWGPRGIAVVLSGALDDGAAGATAVVAAGGRLLVQAPEDAVVTSMPISAIAAAHADAVLPAAAELGAALSALVVSSRPSRDVEVAIPPDPAEPGPVPTRPDGPPSGFTCPGCHGPLWEVQEGVVDRYRCRVGHAYSEHAMIEAQGVAVEAALWTALEVLQERSELLTRIADRSDAGIPGHQHTLRAGARAAEDRATILRRVLAMSDVPRQETG